MLFVVFIRKIVRLQCLLVVYRKFCSIGNLGNRIIFGGHNPPRSKGLMWAQDEIKEILSDKPNWAVGDDGGLRYTGGLVVPNEPDLKLDIFYEENKSRYMIHPGST